VLRDYRDVLCLSDAKEREETLVRNLVWMDFGEEVCLLATQGEHVAFSTVRRLSRR
jgi:hypothetical protein